MPVVGAGGLVGQVIQSFHHTAVVRLVTDGQSKVGVTFGPTQTHTATVDGQGPNSSMTADLVPPHTPLHKGQIMYTSGFDAAAFPPGIPVATRDVVPHQRRRQPGDDRRHTHGQSEPVGLCRRRALGAGGVSGRATLRVALVTLLLLLVQSTVMLSIRIGGTHPDILWLLPITAAILTGPNRAPSSGSGRAWPSTWCFPPLRPGRPGGLPARLCRRRSHGGRRQTCRLVEAGGRGCRERGG